MTSASIAQRTATVWNRNDPMPTRATSPASAVAARSRLGPEPARRKARNAATRKAALEAAFSGSAQKPASPRSQ